VYAYETVEERTLIGQIGDKYEISILGSPECHVIYIGTCLLSIEGKGREGKGQFELLLGWFLKGG